MNSMVWLGVLLIVIGFLIAIPRRMRAGSPRDVDLTGGHSFASPRQTTGNQRPRERLNGVLIGLGVMALGGLCVALAN